MALAGSMTLGALALSWLEQQCTPPVLSAQNTLPAESAHEAVARRSADLIDWSGVELVALSNQSDLLSLTATQPQQQHDVHFLVSTTGEVIVQPAWRDQLRVDNNHRILIGIVAATDAGITYRSQLDALQALLSELNTAAGPAFGPQDLRITIEQGHPRRAIAEAVLRQLAATAKADRA
jgi:hypothetical protein